MQQLPLIATSPQEKGKEKVYSIQVLRAIAALLVVYMHSMTSRIALFTGVSYQSGLGYLSRFGAVGVDIFFIISGCIIVMIGQKYADKHQPHIFFLKRAYRIVSLYWPLSLLLLAASQFALFQGLLSDLTWQRLFTSFFFVPLSSHGVYQAPIIAVGWTLSMEMFFYVVVALCMYANPKKYLQYTVVVLLLVVLAGSLLAMIHSPLTYALSPIFLEFVFGILIGVYSQKSPQRTKRPLLIVLGLLGFLLSIFLHHLGIANVNEILYGNLVWVRLVLWGIPSALFVQGFLDLEAMSTIKMPTFLVRLGDASYSLYLIHTSFITVLAILWRLLGIHAPDLFVLVSVVCSALVGYLFYFQIEKRIMKLQYRFVT